MIRPSVESKLGGGALTGVSCPQYGLLKLGFQPNISLSTEDWDEVAACDVIGSN